MRYFSTVWLVCLEKTDWIFMKFFIIVVKENPAKFWTSSRSGVKILSSFTLAEVHTL